MTKHVLPRLAAAAAAAITVVAVSAVPATAATNGANSGCGAYCPSNIGDPSGNGQGDGKAVGRPPAGTVGNADEKNPPGQAPDGSDDNNGYECDENSGVGKTNPAHTGCAPTLS